MRALEIHDRDGWRRPRLLRFGPLTGVVSYLTEMVARYVVRSYTHDIARRLHLLYARREAQAADGSSERHLLAGARAEADLVSSGYRGGTFPAVVSGLAAVPLVAGLSRPLGTLDWLDATVQAVLGGVLFVLFGVVSYVLLQGAATARRRAHLLMKQPLEALWETIGRAGRPPQDDATTFAAVAIVLTFLGWFLLPAVVAVAVAT